MNREEYIKLRNKKSVQLLWYYYNLKSTKKTIDNYDLFIHFLNLYSNFTQIDYKMILNDLDSIFNVIVIYDENGKVIKII